MLLGFAYLWFLYGPTRLRFLQIPHKVICPVPEHEQEILDELGVAPIFFTNH